MILFWPPTFLIVLARLVGPWALLVALSIPRLLPVLEVFDQPERAGPPPGHPARGWPLWFVATRSACRAGGQLALGLVLNALRPVESPPPRL